MKVLSITPSIWDIDMRHTVGHVCHVWMFPDQHDGQEMSISACVLAVATMQHNGRKKVWRGMVSI